MQFRFTTILTTVALISLTPTVSAVCCVYGSIGECDRIVEDPSSRIYNSDEYVPEEGATNVLTGAEISNLTASVICCCSSANSLACRTKVSSYGASVLITRRDIRD